MKQYPRGWSAGYGEFRYGNPRPVYDPGKPVKMALTKKELGALAHRVSGPLSHGGPSRWGAEATVTHNVRRGLLTRGHSFPVAELEAAEVVKLGFAKIGASKRPTYDEGQPEATVSDGFCLWCNCPLDDDDIARGLKFCCPEHGRFSGRRMEGFNGWRDTILGKAVHKIVAREGHRERICAHCGKPFKAMDDGSEQKFCSKRCHIASMTHQFPERDCEFCGKPFRPTAKNPDQRFCCQTHATAALRTVQPRHCAHCHRMFTPKGTVREDGSERGIYCSKDCEIAGRSVPKFEAICLWCGLPFLGKTKKAKWCCEAHANLNRRWDRGVFPKRLSPEVFDHMAMPLLGDRTHQT
jgi:hypothetical protein